MLNDKQKITNFETLCHIGKVRNYINVCIIELLKRGENHDKTKLNNPELDLLVEYTPKLAECTYGGDEYMGYLEELKVALEHHYANNRHHPECFKNGINDMTLIDLLEMFCDWKAASERHNDGNIRKSIEINGARFGMSPQLIRIFENSVDIFNNAV